MSTPVDSSSFDLDLLLRVLQLELYMNYYGQQAFATEPLEDDVLTLGRVNLSLAGICT